MEQINTAVVQPMLQTAQTEAENGYTTVFSGANVNLPDQSENVLHYPSVNSTPLGTADLVIKQSSCPWFHQEVVALMG
jgi:hypothetical protein